jgi:hypothetical protein
MLNEEVDLNCDQLLEEIAEATVDNILMSDSEDEYSFEMTQEDNSPSFDAPFSVHPGFGSSVIPYYPTDAFQSPTPVRTHSTENDITTVMLRNIPNKYTRAGLLAALTEFGFDPSTCNNLYLPMDTESGCNLGYAFLNFMAHEFAVNFKYKFDGCRLPSSGSRKVCSVVWANKQGLFQFNQQVPQPPIPVDVAIPDRVVYHEMPPMDSTKIFIGGLPISTTDLDLFNYFSQFGPVKECNIIINKESGLSRGFGFVDFHHLESIRIVDEAQKRAPHVINCRVVSVRFYGAYNI